MYVSNRKRRSSSPSSERFLVMTKSVICSVWMILMVSETFRASNASDIEINVDLVVGQNHTDTSNNNVINETSIFHQSKSSSSACQEWCDDHPAPWNDPDVSISQKCRWSTSCGGCPECTLMSTTTQSVEGFIFQVHRCYSWCDNHPRMWKEKCTWLDQCAACPECYSSEIINDDNDDDDDPSIHFPTTPPLTQKTVSLSLAMHTTDVPTVNNPTPSPSTHPVAYKSITPSSSSVTAIDNPSMLSLSYSSSTTQLPSIPSSLEGGGIDVNGIIWIILRTNNDEIMHDDTVLIAKLTNITELFLADLVNDIDGIIVINEVVVSSKQIIEKGPQNGIDIIVGRNDALLVVADESYMRGTFLVLKLAVTGRMEAEAYSTSDSFLLEEMLVQSMNEEQNMNLFIKKLNDESIFYHNINNDGNSFLPDVVTNGPTKSEREKSMQKIFNPFAITAVFVASLVGSLMMLFALLIFRKVKLCHAMDSIFENNSETGSTSPVSASYAITTESEKMREHNARITNDI